MSYSITDLAKEFNITPRALRFYEDKGLIKPKRQGVTRVFSDRDRVRLALTLRGKRLGFSLEEVKEIIEMYDPSQPDDPRQLLHLLKKIHEHRKEIINKMNDITDTLKLMHEVESRALALLGKRPAKKNGQLDLELS